MDEVRALHTAARRYCRARHDEWWEVYRGLVALLDREGKGINIVVNLPDEIKQRKITLDLIDVSASEVLKYMAEVGSFEVRVDRSIVYISTKDASSTQPATQVTQPPVPELPPIPGAN